MRYCHTQSIKNAHTHRKTCKEKSLKKKIDKKSTVQGTISCHHWYDKDITHTRD
jgi:hypothetical protein